MEDKLRKLFGDDFVKKYKRLKQEAGLITDVKVLKEIFEFARQNIPKSDDMRCVYKNLDVILANTPDTDRLREIKQTEYGSYKITMIWYGAELKSLRGPFISVFVPETKKEWAERLTRTPNEPFLLIGKLTEREYEGDIVYSFRLKGIIPLEETEQLFGQSAGAVGLW